MPRCREVRYSLPSSQPLPCGSQVCPSSGGGLQLTTGTSLPSGVRYEIHPEPIATNHRLPWVSNAPPSRNLPCGVLLISANFSTGPTPAGNGGNPQGCTGAGGGVGDCARAAPPGPLTAQTIPSNKPHRPSISKRRTPTMFPP